MPPWGLWVIVAVAAWLVVSFAVVAIYGAAVARWRRRRVIVVLPLPRRRIVSAPRDADAPLTREVRARGAVRRKVGRAS